MKTDKPDMMGREGHRLVEEDGDGSVERDRDRVIEHRLAEDQSVQVLVWAEAVHDRKRGDGVGGIDDGTVEEGFKEAQADAQAQHAAQENADAKR